LLKNPVPKGFVSGHDFSRADKVNQINGALAPAGCLPRQFHSIEGFFNKLLEADSLSEMGRNDTYSQQF
jgi:hypothetical protein